VHVVIVDNHPPELAGFKLRRARHKSETKPVPWDINFHTNFPFQSHLPFPLTTLLGGASFEKVADNLTFQQPEGWMNFLGRCEFSDEFAQAKFSTCGFSD
jgi:hypothetical protein